VKNYVNYKVVLVLERNRDAVGTLSTGVETSGCYNEMLC